MQVGNVTTPFGRRTVSLGHLKTQMDAGEIEDGASVDKWKIYRALCEARTRLGVNDRALAVLNALLSFYPKNTLDADDSLIVFPSNAQLSLRAHGMAEQTIRRHVAVLVDAGLLIRKDSANGKRFARRGREGSIDEAFGFSLAPLLARAEEIEQVAAEVEAERIHLHHMREQLTICRRDVAKLIATALEEGAPGNWDAAESEYRTILSDLPRNAPVNLVTHALEAMRFLRENVLNQLEMLLKTQKQGGNDHQNERHIQNSNSESYDESEPRFEKLQDENLAETDEIEDLLDGHENGDGRSPDEAGGGRMAPQTKSLDFEIGLKPFPLGMVLSACPQMSDYGPNGAISSWRDLMAAAVVVRSMLGVSPSAYQEACEVLGPENAATVMACILERTGQINSAGGYLRDLTRRAERQEFSLGPMLMAQIRANGGSERKAG
ncbi:plasmid replication protein RepC [Rhizobium sp. L1K21]|uniref:plasmid replication protein RepC n=1 Tax=Rhizobium sp. L1K21 TaxID=2954933 RepID=UPI0020926E62|nr:plasmid replication protein RepC [Rhizobium sp. L1K21]MCO6187625.1 replication initiation protein RepC [Rhizobium sp. L1K21]